MWNPRHHLLGSGTSFDGPHTQGEQARKIVLSPRCERDAFFRRSIDISHRCCRGLVQTKDGFLSRHYAILVKVTNAAGVSKSATLNVSVIVAGRRRRRVLIEESDRVLHPNASPDPAVRILLAEAKGILGSITV